MTLLRAMDNPGPHLVAFIIIGWTHRHVGSSQLGILERDPDNYVVLVVGQDVSLPILAAEHEVVRDPASDHEGVGGSIRHAFQPVVQRRGLDRKSTRLNSSHSQISY